MEIKLTMFPDYINWVEGYVDGTFFQAKLYDEPSVHGINEGRVSKLYIATGVNYDRGWDIGVDHPLVGPVVNFLEATPKRFEGRENERISATEAYSRYRKERGY